MALFLIITFDQHPVILGKPWIKKYGMIFNINYNKLIFWPDHCQHAGAVENAPKVKKMQYVSNFTVKDILNEKNKLDPISTIVITINPNFSKPKLQIQVTKPDDKLAIDKYPKLLLYILFKHKNISKIAIFLKQILK